MRREVPTHRELEGCIWCGRQEDVSLFNHSAFSDRNTVSKNLVHALEMHGSKSKDRAEIVRWVAESMRPFNIVRDHGFECLMKTGRPEYKLPSLSMVGHDVRKVFAHV